MMHFYTGYIPVADDEDLRAFNRCIKVIIQRERAKWLKSVNC